ncbi:MAG: OmpA family protein [Pseudomonadota bacterium]
MAALGKLFLGLVLVMLMGVAATRTDVLPGSLSSAQERLQRRAESALSDAGADWALVRIDGQKAVLSGQAPSEDARDEAADAIAGAVWSGGLVLGGVTAVDVSADVSRPILAQEVPAKEETEPEPIEDTVAPVATTPPPEPAIVVTAEEEEPEEESEEKLVEADAGAGDQEALRDITPTVPKPKRVPAAPDATCLAALKNVISRRNITFDTARTEIDAASRAHLLDIAEALRGCSGFSLLISGHTDSRGVASRNRQLSLYRADAVAAYLRSVGVDGALLQTNGLGSTEPLISNATPEGRAQNRRIEITVISNLPE